MLAFYGDHKPSTARKSADYAENRDTLIEQSVILIQQSLRHYYSNRAVT